MTKQNKLVCKDLWKLYGAGVDAFVRGTDLSRNDFDLETRGLIGAVQRVNLEIKEGEIFVIMGLSGSGKSTLVRLMSGLIEPTAGELLLDGQNLLQMSERELIEIRRHKMGMVFQHFALLPHLSVLQNVAFPLTIQGQSKSQAETRAQEVVDLVGLKGREQFLSARIVRWPATARRHRPKPCRRA